MLSFPLRVTPKDCHERPRHRSPHVRPAAAAAPTTALVAWDLIRTLVGFDTTSRDSNLALIDWVRDYLAGSASRRR